VLGLRKPDVESYQKLLQLHHLAAAETLFVDDTPKNIEGASKAGLQTLWLAPGQLLEEELTKFLQNT
jgi:putative hydrolase of the HAD superfamily